MTRPRLTDRLCLQLPARIRAEVKLTVSGSISVTARETRALLVEREDEIGIIAALFVNATADFDGSWDLVDARAYRRRSGDGISLSQPSLIATATRQPWLNSLRRHVNGMWPAFLEAFHENAEHGHAALVEELERLYREGHLGDRLPTHRILQAEHRATLRRIVDRHGESIAGRLVQDLLAYLVAMAGYEKVTNNPGAGVPDFVVEGRRGNRREDVGVWLRLVRSDAQRLVRLCQGNGEDRLAEVLKKQLLRGRRER